MKTKINSIIALSVLAFIALACNASFTTAKIGSLKFGKNETATPPATTFDVGEKIYAVTDVSGSVSKQKLKFKLTYENVQGKGKGEVAFSKDLDIEGSSTANFFFTTPLPGEYKVEAALVDEQGKEIDKKSGTVTVKGSPATSTQPKEDKDTGSDSDSEDTSKDK